MMKHSLLTIRSYQAYLGKQAWLIALPIFLGVVCACLFLFKDQFADLLMAIETPSQDQGRVFYEDFVVLTATEMLWVLFFALLTWLMTRFFSDSSLNGFIDSVGAINPVHSVSVILAIFLAATLFTAFQVLEQFANSSNEYAYLFQAELLSREKIWERSHDLPDFFYFNNIVQEDGVLTSRFPPGWPMVLSLALSAGFTPALVNPLIGLLTLIVFYVFAKRLYDHKVAVWALAVLALTSFFVFNSASFFSHVLCALVAVLLAGNLILYESSKSIVYGMLAGFLVGFMIMTRYFTAVLVIVPFVVYHIYHYKLQCVRLFALMVVGSLPCIIFFIWYNYTVTGDIFLPIEFWAYPQRELGFVKGHSLFHGVEHLIRRFFMFIYWTSPGLIFLFFILIAKKIKSVKERLSHPEDYIILSLIFGYFFYFQIGGNQYGPRFLFEGFPFLVLFVVRHVIISRERLAVALLLSGILVSLVKFPVIAQREAGIVDQRQDLYDLVEENNLRNAVVLVAASTSPIRPMPADDLTRNNSKFFDNVIYALEIPGIAAQLMDHYQDRDFYRYDRDVDSVTGTLIKVDKQFYSRME